MKDQVDDWYFQSERSSFQTDLQARDMPVCPNCGKLDRVVYNSTLQCFVCERCEIVIYPNEEIEF